MLKNERYYDGEGSELRIIETEDHQFKVSVVFMNRIQTIVVPKEKLFDMLADGKVKGKHAKVYETR